MIPEDNYTIPAEAEGIEATPVQGSAAEEQPSLLKRDPSSAGQFEQPVGNSTLATGNTTKRHRGTMHDRQTSVSTIIHEEVEEEEGDEEEEDDDEDHEAEPQRGVVREVQPELHLTQQTTITQGTPETSGSTYTASASNDDAVELDAEDADAEEKKRNRTSVIYDGGREDKVAEAPVEEESVVEAMDTAESAAADGDEASKSVAD